MNEEIKPFIIITDDGRIAEVIETNRKGYLKSIENSTLWAVNPETGRLLPHETDYRIGGFSEKDGWYEVRVAENTEKAQVSDEKKTEDGNAVSAGDSSAVIESLFRVIEKRRQDMPEGSYTTHLFKSGLSKIKKKTGEEAVELLLAEDRDETIYEAADLIYHMLVLLSASGIEPSEIFAELKNRE